MSRLVVALDTATEAIALGIARVHAPTVAGGAETLEILGERIVVAPRRANELLLSEVAALVGRAGEALADVGAVVVGRGPGSFTGVRIGVASAKGLAHGLACPLAGVGSLDAVAWRAGLEDGLLGVLGDAMRGEVYPALFRLSGGRAERLTPDTVGKPADVAAEWAATLDEPIRLTGNGLAKYADVFAESLRAQARFAVRDEWWPTGAGLLGAFMSQGGTAQLVSAHPGALLPIYTRLSDAEEAERSRAAITGGSVGDGPRADGAGAPS